LQGYPNARPKISRWIDPKVHVRFFGESLADCFCGQGRTDERLVIIVQEPDGTRGCQGPRKSVEQYIQESDNPKTAKQNFYCEAYLAEPVEIPRCVQEELSFGLFATEGFGSGLRTPNLELPEIARAREAIATTMPAFYGEPSGMSFSFF
jgi:hypothetical protein